jgi:glycosyltransferase involved in cell wall biosynthesis
VRVAYFGTYDRSYPRNAQVISSLRGAGVEVVERNVAVWGRNNWSVGLRQLVRLAGAERRLGREGSAKGEVDALIVGYPGHFDVPKAKRAARGAPIVFNPLVSLHDTMVSDRGRFRDGGAGSAVLRAVDRRAFRGADLVVADTDAHAEYFRTRFGLPSDRVAVCLVGAEDHLFTPAGFPGEPFHVVFVGKLIPLHGVETILAAAALAPEIPFRIVGSGQLDQLLDERPDNVTWVDWVEYEELPAVVRAAACVLGVFGTSDKAARVIPNKAFHALACARPLVTADTPAARELLTDGRDALLVPPGDAAALAAAVRRLRDDPALGEMLASAGRRTYERRASEAVLGARWRELLEDLVRAR